MAQPVHVILTFVEVHTAPQKDCGPGLGVLNHIYGTLLSTPSGWLVHQGHT